MRLTPFIVLATFSFLIVMGRPNETLNHSASSGNVQEERQEEELPLWEQDNEIIHVSFETLKLGQQPIADIIWLRKAAKLALKGGSPYFNVLNQEISKNFIHNKNCEMISIEGSIQLENNGMLADYDAHEILSLSISKESL